MNEYNSCQNLDNQDDLILINADKISSFCKKFYLLYEDYIEFTRNMTIKFNDLREVADKFTYELENNKRNKSDISKITITPDKQPLVEINNLQNIENRNEPDNLIFEESLSPSIITPRKIFPSSQVCSINDITTNKASESLKKFNELSKIHLEQLMQSNPVIQEFTDDLICEAIPNQLTSEHTEFCENNQIGDDIEHKFCLFETANNNDSHNTSIYIETTQQETVNIGDVTNNNNQLENTNIIKISVEKLNDLFNSSNSEFIKQNSNISEVKNCKILLNRFESTLLKTNQIQFDENKNKKNEEDSEEDRYIDRLCDWDKLNKSLSPSDSSDSNFDDKKSKNLERTESTSKQKIIKTKKVTEKCEDELSDFSETSCKSPNIELPQLFTNNKKEELLNFMGQHSIRLDSNESSNEEFNEDQEASFTKLSDDRNFELSKNINQTNKNSILETKKAKKEYGPIFSADLRLRLKSTSSSSNESDIELIQVPSLSNTKECRCDSDSEYIENASEKYSTPPTSLKNESRKEEAKTSNESTQININERKVNILIKINSLNSVS